MRRIFIGDFRPGTRLPAERVLASELGVDRTSLRMALRQLQRMKLIVPRHGSGIEVADYKAEGGLDVLAAMFSMEKLPLEGSFMVEALDFWIESFSMTAAKAMVRMSLDDLRTIESLLDRGLVAPGRDELVETQIQVQEELARLSGSLIFRMLSNSTRSLRRRFLYLLVDTVDLPASVAQIKLMLRSAALNPPSEALIRQGLDAALRAQTAPLRELLLFGGPRSVEPPAAKPRATE